ncbi:Protein of unknown function [Thermoactinomyces sp. DSM 45891]|uniref:DUF2642 domain-containing protein n=1 Tax=Thermoactinomyces sp. DSM 45891 TaxID=1761907 RepID=UPI000919EC21|nr:DUF2642 domain-containing protein [Thermoactinomyces sp. DSM 45891]SFX12285.1 Protein of unknown function [Thermoactinomyces sp. DSM 45891]
MENNYDVKREPYRPMPVPKKPMEQPSGYSRMELVEPYLYEALRCLCGRKVCVTTTCGKYRGQLLKVKRDHLVICEGQCVCYIRLQTVCMIMPEPKC